MLQALVSGHAVAGTVSEEFCSIVGMSLRYPGKAGREGFWAAATSLTDIQQGVPHSRWNNDTAYSPNIRPGKLTTSTRLAFPTFLEFPTAGLNFLNAE